MNYFAFRCENEGQNIIPDIQLFLTTQTAALRTLIIHSGLAHLPDSPLFMDNLRSLDLCITIPDAACLRQLLESGQQLESLLLGIRLDGSALSSAFRRDRSHSVPCSLPKLREFEFILLEADSDDDEDPDLFPVVAEFVRGHPMLEALCLSYRESRRDPEDFGYTAAIWGVLPSLVHLRTLSMDAPEDLSCKLSGWLVPRTVVALEVRVLYGASWKGNCDVRMFHKASWSHDTHR